LSGCVPVQMAGAAGAAGAAGNDATARLEHISMKVGSCTLSGGALCEELDLLDKFR